MAPSLAYNQSIETVATYIGRVVQKLENGTYPREDVRCFCGAEPDHDIVITEKDRYFIPHRMVLCPECALIRATPRMTQAAYDAFYNTEYRPIYDGWQFGKKGDDFEYRFMRQVEKGVDFKEFMDYFGIKPKVVVDIGCNMGGNLMPFMNEGVEVWGADVCHDSVEYGRSRGLNLIEGGIDEIIAKGIKADLVTTQDFIEHLLDFRELAKLRQILKPDGYLYVGTPGLFKWNLATVFQNAHPHQFVAATLSFVLQAYGFKEIYLDEEISSLWSMDEQIPAQVRKPKEWVPYILEHLQQKEYRRMPPIRTINKFPVPQLIRNMEANIAHRRPDLSDLVGKKSGPVVVVCGGPSVDGQLDKIKELVAGGAALAVIERMYPWCHTHGLHPDYVMSMDCSEGVQDGFTHIQDDTLHFLSAVTHPALFDLLKDRPVYILNGYTALNYSIQDLWTQHGYTKTTLVNTGGSITLGLMSLCMTLGHKNLHVFGFDCMVSKEAAYAGGIAGESISRTYFPVEIDGQEYITCASFISFAQSFFHMMEGGRKSGLLESIDVYGESLVNKMWDKSVIEPAEKELAHG